GDKEVSGIEGDGHQARLRKIEDPIDLQDQREGHGEHHVVTAGGERGPKDLRHGREIEHQHPSGMRTRRTGSASSAQGCVTPLRSSRKAHAAPAAPACRGDLAMRGRARLHLAMSLAIHLPFFTSTRKTGLETVWLSETVTAPVKGRSKVASASISLRKFSPVGARPFLSIDVRMVATMYGASCRYCV